MKWINGLDSEDSWEAMKLRLSNWHPWFAWYPVTIGKTEDKRQIKVWLTVIERKGTWIVHWDGPIWDWEYREKPLTLK